MLQLQVEHGNPYESQLIHSTMSCTALTPDCSHFSEHCPVTERVPEQCWYTQFVLGGTFCCKMACNVLCTGSRNSGNTARRSWPNRFSYVTGKWDETSRALRQISSSCLSENMLCTSVTIQMEKRICRNFI